MQRTIRIKLISVVLLLVMLVGLMPLNVIADTIPLNDVSASVTLHFYNCDNEYQYDNWGNKDNVTWGAYYWVQNSHIVASDGKDNEFAYGNNIGQTYTLTFNDTETRSLKAGNQLGLIMVRAYMDNGTYQPHWNGNSGRDITSDRFVTVNFDKNNHADLWIVSGDKTVYTTLDSAKPALESIQSARFDNFNTIYVKSTTMATAETGYRICAVSDRVANPQGTVVTQGTVAGDGLNTQIDISAIQLENTFDWNSDYMLYFNNYEKPIAIDKSRLYLSSKFKADCLPDINTTGIANVALGSTYALQETTFRLWAPISTNVYVNLYKTGDSNDDTLYQQAVEMTLKEKGVWEATVSGDLDGVYYTYTNYVAGMVYEICDPYATATGVNGNRAMVCDLDATDPEGWENDLEQNAIKIRENNSKVPVIWEIHIRDFSISADSGLKYKGKYLAFTEQDTFAKGSNDTIKTGISYLQDLGVNYVHLNPVYDFATVDEQRTAETDYATKQNWGYDPKNYNVPEGSYSTNPYDGDVRINEFKQMVLALHNAGIGVIMDVVYNHTYSIDGWFDQSVPGYYYRQALGSNGGSFDQREWSVNSTGTYNMGNASGCGNETASEREMYRSYMVNSVLYWATEYHIDGFRFDLMAVHDVSTMRAIRNALNKLEGGSGILMYGEPWAAADVQLDNNIHNASKNYINELNGIKAFNDTARDALRGNNSLSGGFINGNSSEDIFKKLDIGIKGGWDGGAQLSSAQSIMYASAHDNYTIWDQLVATTIKSPTATMFSEGNSVVLRRNMMSAAITLMSKGTSFILAGEEIARTKYGNHNSYNAQDQVNEFDYYRQEQFTDLYNWYKGLIALRTQYFTTMANPEASITVTGYKANDADKSYQTLTICFDRHASNANDQYLKVQVMINVTATESRIPFTDSWQVIADSSISGTFDFDSMRTVGNGDVIIPAYSTLVIVTK